MTLNKTLNFIHLVLVKVRFNLRSEASKTYLSYAWWVLEPILHLGVFFLVFGTFLNRGTGDFVTFLFCGIVPWLWFSKSVANSALCMIGGKGLISQTYIPKAFFPLVNIAQDTVKQFFVFLMLFIYLIVAGYAAGPHWVWLIPVIITQFALIAAVTFLVSFVVPFALDLRYLVNTILIFGMLSSGVFYSYEQVILPQHRDIFLMNPMANLIVNYRLVLMEGKAPMVSSLATIFLCSAAFIWFMVRVMKKYDNNLARRLIE